MGSFQHSYVSIFDCILLFLRAIVNIPLQNSYNYAMTLISQDNHLPAGAWAACAVNRKNQSPYNCAVRVY